MEDGFSNSTTIRCFFSLETGGDDDLWNIFQFYLEAERIPPGVLPIAEDIAGNLVCLCIDREDAGAIYYWDHELELDMAKYDELTRLAADLPSFLSMLKDD